MARILVVEDKPEQRALAMQAGEAAGHDVACVATFPQFLVAMGQLKMAGEMCRSNLFFMNFWEKAVQGEPCSIVNALKLALESNRLKFKQISTPEAAHENTTVFSLRENESLDGLLYCLWYLRAFTWDGIVTDWHFPSEMAMQPKGEEYADSISGLYVVGLAQKMGTPCVVCSDEDGHSRAGCIRTLRSCVVDFPYVCDKNWEEAFRELNGLLTPNQSCSTL